MKTFLLLVENVPPSIIFTPSQRLSIPGFLWAPRTLMSLDAVATLLDHEHTVLCTPTGLLAEYEILRFPGTTMDHRLANSFVDTSKGQTYQNRPESSTDTRTCTCNAILAHKFPWRAEWVVAAVVWVPGEGAVESESERRLLCEFRRRIHLIDVWDKGKQKSDVSAEGFVVEGRSGCSKVRLT